MPNVQHKRGTRAALVALAGANGLLPGQVYVLTDESRIAVALTVSTFETFAKESEAGGGGGSGDVVGPAASVDRAVTVFDGTTGKLIEGSPLLVSPTGAVTLPEQTLTPPNPEAGNITLFAGKSAARMLPIYLGPRGVRTALQPHIGRNRIARVSPSGGGTVVHLEALPNISLSGLTAQTRAASSASFYGRIRKIGYQTAATANTNGAYRHANANFFGLGDGAGVGGYHMVMRFGISDPVLVNTARSFWGMGPNTATGMGSEPSSLTNIIGVGHGVGQTTLHFYCAGTSAQPGVDLGANFPVKKDVAYELAIFSSPEELNTFEWCLTRLDTGAIATGVITVASAAVGPITTNLLTPFWAFRSNTTTAAAVAWDLIFNYIETDN